MAAPAVVNTAEKPSTNSTLPARRLDRRPALFDSAAGASSSAPVSPVMDVRRATDTGAAYDSR